jgi:hypothetical protein
MRWGHRVAALFLAVACGGAATACSVTGSAATSPAASGGAGQTQEGETCFSRDGMRWVAGAYLYLMAMDDPTPLPVTPELRFTENGQRIELGEGFWQTAGEARFSRTVVDTERCGTHTEAVVEENGVDVIFGMRLLLEDGRITEIETYVTREGDYVFFNPEGLVASDDEGPADVSWEQTIPEEQRSTRDELIEIADLYYQSFGPGGVVAPIENDCYRWENGQSTATGDCSVGIGVGSPDMITHRRYPMVDVEAGVVVAYVLFGTALDFHMFKVVDGQVRLLDAVVTASGHESTGWEDQE